MSRSVTATMRFLLDTSSMSTGVQQVSRGLKGLDKQAISLGKTLGVTFGAATVGMVLRNALGVVNAYSDANSRLAAILGTVKSETKDLQVVQQQLGAATKFTASQVADAQTELAKLGFTQREIAASTKGVLDLAAASNIEIARAAEIAGGTLRGFGLDAAETGRVVDVMASSFTKSGLDAEKFAETMKVVSPIARNAGIDLETTSSLAGVLANSLISGSVAGTGLKNLLSELSNPTSSLAKELGFTVKSSEDLFRAFDILKDRNIDLAAATELTDERSKAAFLTLLNGTDTLRQLDTEFRNAAGAAGQLAETMTDNLTGDIDKAKSAWEGLVLSLEDGEGSISKVLRGVVQSATDILTAFRQLNEASDVNFSLGISTSELDNIKKNALVTQERLQKRISELQASGDEEGRAALIEKVTAKIENQAKSLEKLEAKQKALLDASNSAGDGVGGLLGAGITATAKSIDVLNGTLGENGMKVAEGRAELEALRNVLAAIKKPVADVTETTEELGIGQNEAAAKARELRMELEGWNALALNDLFGESQAATIDGLAQALSELYVAGEIGANDFAAALSKVTGVQREILDDNQLMAASFSELFDAPEMEDFTANLEALKEGKEQAAEASELLIASLQRENEKMQLLGSTITGVLENGLNNFEDFGKGAIDSLKKLVVQLAAAAGAAALLSVFFPAAGGFKALFGQLSGFGSLFGGNGGGGSLNVNGIIQGRDIVLSNQNSGNFINRVGG